MKRMICLILALAMIVTLAACGGKEEPVVTTATEVSVETDEAVAPETTETPTEEVTEATEAPAPVTPVDTLLMDTEDCTFSVGMVTIDEMAGMQVAVTCVNKTQESLDFAWSNVSVCGMMYDPNWAITVPAGETVTSQVEIDTYALELMGIQSADEVTFRLDVLSSENWMGEPLAQAYMTIYPTGLSADTVIYPVREAVVTETVLVDDENLTFIIEYVQQQDLYYVARCYIVNKTQNTLMTSWENVSVNGQAVDPFWTALVAPGKSAYAEVKFADSELKGLGIEVVDSITFDLTAYNDADWGELVNVPVSYVPVEEAALG